MKKLKALLAVAGALVCVCAFTACMGDFDYESDESILRTRAFSSVMSVIKERGDSYTFTAQSCTGVDEFQKITVPENPVFDLSLKLEKGKFKVVLIKNKTVYTVCEGTVGETLNVPVQTGFRAGTYDLCMVADDAKVEFEFYYNNYR